MRSWVYLQQLLGYGSTNTAKVLGNIKNPNGIENATKVELHNLGFTETQISRHGKALINSVEEIIKQCSEKGITITPYAHPNYPKKLMNIYAPPVVLYSIGVIKDLDSLLTVAVVGTRKITEVGAKTAFSLSARLALCGVAVVSGGAVGGDAYAHMGAMAANGYTVAVTGGGLLSGYLVKNRELRYKIFKRGGLLITEFAPEYVPKDKNSFYLRNRILSGLCDITAIIEAGTRSGTLITANHAAEQGREVYAIDGDSNLPQYKGTARLLEDGAMPITSVEAMLKPYSLRVNFRNINDISKPRLKELYEIASGELDKKLTYKKTQPKKRIITPKKEQPPKTDKMDVLSKLSGDAAKVYSAINETGNIADEIVAKTGLTTSAVLIALTKLEIMGYIKSMPGSRYCIK